MFSVPTHQAYSGSLVDPVDEPVDDGDAEDARRLEVGRRRLPVFVMIIQYPILFRISTFVFCSNVPELLRYLEIIGVLLFPVERVVA